MFMSGDFISCLLSRPEQFRETSERRSRDLSHDLILPPSPPFCMRPRHRAGAGAHGEAVLLGSLVTPCAFRLRAAKAFLTALN